MRDFSALADWFRLKWDYENTPILQRPTSLTWDICKTNLTKGNNRSGKSTPSLGSGRNSPNVSGKISPRILQTKPKSSTSAPTSPLPHFDQPILEGIPIEIPLQKKTIENEEVISQKLEKKLEMVANASQTEENNELEEKQKLSKSPIEKKAFEIPKPANVKSKASVCKLKEGKPSTMKKDSLVKAATPTKLQTEKNSNLKKNSDVSKDSPEKYAEEIKSVIIPPKVPPIDSPSDDQKTYDILRKIGVQSAEKSTSTEDFPRLPPVKKSNVAKVNQESQTEESDKKNNSTHKNIKTDVTKVSKPVTTVRPAYSTALTRSVSVKNVPTQKPKVEIKTNVSNIKPGFKSTSGGRSLGVKSTTTPSILPKNALARSKTVGDMKTSKMGTYQKAKPTTSVNKNGPIKTIKAIAPLLSKSNTTLTKDQLRKTFSLDEYASSAETLVNQRSNENIIVTNSSNSITSSSETLNNDNVKSDNQHSDGWLTVRCRSRFKNNGKSRRSDTGLSWATRFHQVSATASLPALALLPEQSEGIKTPNKCIEKSVKENLNTFKSLQNTVEQKKMPLKRSHTTLSKMTLNKGQDRNKTNLHIKKSAEERRMKVSDIDSETDDESKFRDMQEDLDTEEEHRKKAKQLSEEEDRLTKEIEKLQCLEIEVPMLF